MALNTERMRLGTCVTNRGTREPSVTASALATRYTWDRIGYNDAKAPFIEPVLSRRGWAAATGWQPPVSLVPPSP